jgi:hypothetical protein
MHQVIQHSSGIGCDVFFLPIWNEDCRTAGITCCFVELTASGNHRHCRCCQKHIKDAWISELKSLKCGEWSYPLQSCSEAAIAQQHIAADVRHAVVQWSFAHWAQNTAIRVSVQHWCFDHCWNGIAPSIVWVCCWTWLSSSRVVIIGLTRISWRHRCLKLPLTSWITVPTWRYWCCCRISAMIRVGSTWIPVGW